MSAYPPAELRAFLVEAGIARKPSEEPQQNGPDAVCYVDPLGGVPYGPDAATGSPAHCQTTIGLTAAGGLGSVAGIGKFMESVFVRVDVRSSSAVAAADVCRAITNALEDQQAIQVGAIRCEYTGIYSRAQSIPVDQETSKGHFKTMQLVLVIHRDQLTA